MRLLLALLGALLPATALAAQQAGMPQFQFGNPLTLTQVGWMAVIFLALYILLARWALPQAGAVLEERARRIAGDLDAAKAAKSEADKTAAELAAATRHARAEAQAAIAAATAAAREAAARQAAVLNARLEAELREAEERINAARDQAMGALREVASAAAATMIARLTGRPPPAAALADAIETSLARTAIGSGARGS